MNLVVGLGNPGEKYTENRHNVGFMAVNVMNALSSKFKVKNYTNVHIRNWTKSKSGLLEYVWIQELGEVELIRPLTFMNRSGEAVKYVVKKHKELSVDNVWVIHDDLDIRLGEYKLSKRGPKIHNGVNSVRRAIGEGFWHVRIGVDNRDLQSASDYQQPGKEYVLGDFTSEERVVVDDVIGRVVMELKEKMNE